MTDAEIKKALECCQTDHCHGSKCPLFNGTVNTKDCITKLSAESLDLINRQQAEIERLQKANGYKRNQIDGLTKLLKRADEIKAEAIKEFAEMLKAKAQRFHHLGINSTGYVFTVETSNIDILVKELVGDAE